MSRLGSGLIVMVMFLVGCTADPNVAAPAESKGALASAPAEPTTPAATEAPQPTATEVLATVAPSTPAPTATAEPEPIPGSFDDVVFYPVSIVGSFDYPEQGLELIDHQLIADAILTYVENLNVNDHTAAAKSIDVPAFSYLEPRLHPEFAEAKRMIFADAEQRDLWATVGDGSEILAVRVEPFDDFREFVLVFCEHVDLEFLNSNGEVQITEKGTVERRATFLLDGALHLLSGLEPTNVVLGEWTGCPGFFD